MTHDVSMILLDVDASQDSRTFFEVLNDVSDVPVIARGVMADTDNVVSYLESGAADFVVRTTTPPVLAAKIQLQMRLAKGSGGCSRFGSGRRDLDRSQNPHGDEGHRGSLADAFGVSPPQGAGGEQWSSLQAEGSSEERLGRGFCELLSLPSSLCGLPAAEAGGESAAVADASDRMGVRIPASRAKGAGNATVRVASPCRAWLGLGRRREPMTPCQQPHQCHTLRCHWGFLILGVTWMLS